MTEPQKFNEFEKWCKTESGVRAMNSFYHLHSKLRTMLKNDLTGCALKKTERILRRSKYFSHYYLDFYPIMKDYNELHVCSSNVEIALSVFYPKYAHEVNLQMSDIKKRLTTFVDHVIQDLKGYSS